MTLCCFVVYARLLNWKTESRSAIAMTLAMEAGQAQRRRRDDTRDAVVSICEFSTPWLLRFHRIPSHDHGACSTCQWGNSCDLTGRGLCSAQGPAMSAFQVRHELSISLWFVHVSSWRNCINMYCIINMYTLYSFSLVIVDSMLSNLMKYMDIRRWIIKSSRSSLRPGIQPLA